VFKTVLDSTRLLLVRTAINGKIDATPIVSSNAIIAIIINNKTKRFFSGGDSRNNIFLKVCIKLKIILIRLY
jgi:hypothetical protein